MMATWTLALVFISATLLNCVCGLKFDFTGVPKIAYSPSCGLIHHQGNWSAQGFLTITSEESSKYAREVHIQANSEHCTIDLTNCGPITSSSVDVCYCASKIGDVYSLYIRGLAKTSQDGQKLRAAIYSKNVNDPSGRTFFIGTLPRVYAPLRAYYQLDNGPQNALTEGQAFYIRSDQREVTLKFCAENLVPRYNLGMTVDGVRTTAVDRCSNLIHTLDTSRGMTYEVTLNYQEGSACRRTSFFKGYLIYKQSALAPVNSNTGSSAGGDKGDKGDPSLKYPHLDLEMLYGFVLGTIIFIGLVTLLVLLICYHQNNKPSVINKENELGSSTLEFTSL